jgi:dolichol-phosphate mannosyltransferase
LNNVECVIVMPVYNEAECIEGVCHDWLTEVTKRGHSLLVVDDGSTDRTAAVLQKLAEREPSLTILHKQNGGHGSAVLAGYQAAVTSGCTWVFQVDSDGQFRAHDFHRLWERRHESDFIVGCRAARHDPLYRRALSKVHRELLSAAFSAGAQDPNAPYRLMRASLLEVLLRFIPPATFAPNVFLTALARAAGCDLLNVPVEHLERSTGESTLHVTKMARLCLLCLKQMMHFRFVQYRDFIVANSRLASEQRKAAEAHPQQ